MKNEELTEQYFEAVVQAGAFTAPISRLQFKLKSLFKILILPVSAYWTLVAAAVFLVLSGASKVVLNEPENAGSRNDTLVKFRQLQSFLPYIDTVQLNTDRFQEANFNNETFDVIILYNSINHLDENSCIHLQNDSQAQENYLQLFHKLYTLANPNADLIICDCSRYSFWPAIGLTNPFNPTIQWYKHQSPYLWKKMLQTVSFYYSSLHWSTPNSLYIPGKILLGNFIVSYFLQSHFFLYMKRK